jgi:hypothetical protein
MEASDRTRLGSSQPLEISTCIFSDGTIESPSSNFKSPDCETRRSSYRDSLAESISEGLDLEHSERLRIERLLSIISESEAPSEELIMNEEIEFYLNQSEENGLNTFVSFTYSKTDKSSTIFENLYSPYTLMNSLPHSPGGPDCFHFSFETCDPRFVLERKDLNWKNLNEVFNKDEREKGGLNDVQVERGEEIEVDAQGTRCFCASCGIF